LFTCIGGSVVWQLDIPIQMLLRLPQAPAANHKESADTMLETFVLSNISPQVGKGFNRCLLLAILNPDAQQRCLYIVFKITICSAVSLTCTISSGGSYQQFFKLYYFMTSHRWRWHRVMQGLLGTL